MANALIPNQNILNRRGYSDEGIDLSLYQDRTGYGLAQLDPYGRVQIGGDPGLQEYLNYLAAPQTREVMGNVLADTIPVSAQGQAIERLKQQYSALQNAQSPIQAAVRAADMGLEGGALVADVLPYGKAAVTGLGALGALMSRKGVPEGMARAPQAANQLGMTGWHGSPHKFDRFDHSNMGKGEGAQAYGWGTYLAENPDVAGMYNVGGKDLAPFTLEKTDPKSIAADLKRYLRNQAYSYNQGKKLQSLGSTANSDFYGLTANRALGDMKLGYFDDAITEASRLGDPSPISRKLAEIADSQGNLYSVDLPDEKIAQMLDWDAPLSEQPESVRKAIDALAAETPDSRLWEAIRKHDMRGEHIYERIVGLNGGAGSIGGDMRASQQLNQLGIPGIKYFDGNSRGAGQGTRNFVVFDENDMKILTRNGEEIAQSADSLPMDEASRMTRAREMGFDEDVFHYSQKQKDDGITEFKTRTTSAGVFDDLGVHSGTSKSARERARKTIEIDRGTGKRKPMQGETYPLKIKKGRQLLGSNGTPMQEEELSDYLRNLTIEIGEDPFSNKGVEALQQHIWSKYDSIPYINDVEDAGQISFISPPKNIRSKFAKYDPAKKNSANLLAGGAAAAFGLNYLAEPERKEYVTK